MNDSLPRRSTAFRWLRLPFVWLWGLQSSSSCAPAAVFFAFGVWALWFARRPRGYLVFAGVFVVFYGWWMTIPALHDRPWQPDVAVMPRAVIDGDRIRIINYRNFDYRSRHDFTERYEEREYLLSHLTGVDFYVSRIRKGLPTIKP